VPSSGRFRFSELLERSLVITDRHMMTIEKKAEHRAQHNNPRKLPKRWIEAYLERKPEQLAEDVLQVFDENFKLRRQVSRDRIVIAVFSSIVTGLAWEGLKALVALLR
jgi:hypothetical protein